MNEANAESVPTGLRVTGLRSSYGNIPVLHGLDLEVHSGEILGVLGHNGMGKTTLLKTLIGLVTPVAGQITFRGADFTREAPHARVRAGIGYVPQGRGMLASLSAEDNLRLAYIGRGGRRAEEQALAQVLDWFPRLKRLLDRKSGALSGGEQQLLSLARALMSGPSLLLLDEPTEGIQPNIVEEMAATLRELHRHQDLSILVVEQNLDFMLDCAQRVLILERGLVVDEIPGEQLGEAGRLMAFAGLGADEERTGHETVP